MTEDAKQDHGQVLVQWNFPEFVKYQRSNAWYFWMLVVFLALLIYAFFSSNFLFAVIIIIGAITFFIIYNREPSQVSFKIMEDGLEIEERFFPYEKLKNFYVIYRPDEVEYLFVEFKSLITPRLSIPLMNQEPSQISDLLNKYLPEDLEKEEEPLSHNLSRKLKL